MLGFMSTNHLGGSISHEPFRGKWSESLPSKYIVHILKREKERR